jgi:hypothetical protein
MITREVTLCGKSVTLAYCYATEIAYKDLTNEDIIKYIRYAIECIQSKEDPDIKQSVFAIVACMIAYSQSKNEEETPVTDKELMLHMSPLELGKAVLAIISMRLEFYKVPDQECGEKKTEKKGKGKGKN